MRIKIFMIPLLIFPYNKLYKSKFLKEAEFLKSD